MRFKFYQADAFTDVPFGGNPAGVVPLISKEGSLKAPQNQITLTEEEMIKIAREINCSETAFIMPSNDPKASLEVRFFTPTEEVDLCGHATIGAFWVLAEKGYIPVKSPLSIITQKTKAGILPVAIYSEDGVKPDNIMMAQNPPTFSPIDLSQGEIAEILGIEAENIKIPRKDNAKPIIASTGLPDLLVPVKNRKALESINPDMKTLAEVSKEKGFISIHPFTFDTIDPESTVYCRDFAPGVGIEEESATGTASGALGAYLTAHALIDIKPPAVKIICEQGHVLKRPSKINVEIDIGVIAEKPCFRYSIDKVKVGGKAVTILEGEGRLS